MNRLFRIGRPLFAFSILSVSMAACQHGSSRPLPDASNPPTTVPCCRYVLSGGVAQPGPKILQAGDTVASVIAGNLPAAPGKPSTIILIRQAPEGKTRRLIQLDATGHLMDEKQNWCLRNGDELVFPGGEGSNSTRNPTGPPARSAD